jgi:hypothetical protein
MPPCSTLRILMTGISNLTGYPEKWAWLYPRFHARYPSYYHAKWFRVYDTHPDPNVRTLPGYVWINVPGRIRGMWAPHFEIAERKRP